VRKDCSGGPTESGNLADDWHPQRCRQFISTELTDFTALRSGRPKWHLRTQQLAFAAVHQWYANLDGKIWDDDSLVPIPGQIVFIHWVYKEERTVEEILSEPASKEYWNYLFKEAREGMRHNQLVEQWKKQSSISSLSFIMSRSKTTVASSLEEGGTPGPAEQNHISVHPPPSPEDKTVKYVNLKTEYPVINISERVAALEEKMSSESLQTMRWVKLARKKEIPYFEPPADLKPFPIESITCPTIPLLVLAPMERPGEADKRRFGAYWDDNFQWDLVSKGVGEARMRMENCCVPSREKLRIWREALKSQLGGIIQDRIGEKMEELIRQSQKDEWDKIIVANLESSRKKDKMYDAKIASLVAYNSDLDEDEKHRRLNSLNLTVASHVWTHYLLEHEFEFPWPDSWCCLGELGEVPITVEEWNSAVDNFPKALKAIERVPDWHLHHRRLAAPEFWRQQKEAWRKEFEAASVVFRKNKEELGGNLNHTEKVIVSIRRDLKRINGEIAQRKEELLAKVKAIRQTSGASILRIPKFQSLGPIDPRTRQRTDPVRAAKVKEARLDTEAKVAPLLRAINWAEHRRDRDEFDCRPQGIPKKTSVAMDGRSNSTENQG
jgi:hypothetical protein